MLDVDWLGITVKLSNYVLLQKFTYLGVAKKVEDNGLRQDGKRIPCDSRGHPRRWHKPCPHPCTLEGV